MSRRMRWVAVLLGAGALVAVLAAGTVSLQIVREVADYAVQSFTNPDFVANVPVRYSLLGIAEGVPDAAVLKERLHIAPGFALGVYAEEIPHPRLLRFTPTGDLLVSQPRRGRILLLEPDLDGDGRSDGLHVLVSGLTQPHGLDLADGWLYVGEVDAISRIRYEPGSRRVAGERERIVDLPLSSNHNLRPVRLGPDGWLYFAVGADCNICLPTDPHEQAILRVRPEGGEPEVYASGFRNVVGLDWQPGSDDLYATEVGADLLGEDVPREAFDRIEASGFYGFPYIHGGSLVDAEYGPGHEERIRSTIPPRHTFTAHSTPLGFAFVRSATAPAALRGAAVVALHGSWNRRVKSGYALVSLHWRDDGEIQERPFVTGFERDGDVIGRPVGVAEGPDGALYVSDDYAGAIYRIVPTSPGR